MSSQDEAGQRWKRRLPPDLGLGLPEPTLMALQHPFRRIILRRLHEGGQAASPVEMMTWIPGVSISLISYHARILRDCGVVRLEKEQQVRGATQHFYVSAVLEDSEVQEVLAETEELDRDSGAG